MKRMIYCLWSLTALFTTIDGYAKSFFIENKGQWNDNVLFAARIKGMNAWIKKDGVVFDFYKIQRKDENTTKVGHVVALHFVNANQAAYAVPSNQSKAYHNYFIGNDPSKWQPKVSLFEEVLIENLYPGIGIRYYFDHGFLRYDFILKAGADPTQIALKVDGCKTNIDPKHNTLVFNTQLGDISQKDLYTYQTIAGEKREVKSEFQLHGELIQIVVDGYNRNSEMIIDPLVFSTFIGGQASDNLWDMKKDGSGNLVFCGTTPGFGYPTTIGAYSTEVEGNADDAVVSKLSADGTQLLFSTFFGGGAQELCQGLAIDSEQSILIVGSTASDNLPVTQGAFNESFNLDGSTTSFDIYVCKFNANGTSIIFSTYLGGTGDDIGRSIAVDNQGNAYVTGTCSSFDFPVTPGAFQTSKSSDNDAFVSKLNSSGNQLIYSTYAGGNSFDEARKIVVSADRSAFVTGTTFSSNFPTTSGTIQNSLSGNRDAYVFRLNSSGSAMIYSSYLGGNNVEDGVGITVDNQHNAYVCGMTRSNDFPITPGAFNSQIGGSDDAFISKINPDGTSFVFSAVFQGNVSDLAHCVSLGSDQTILVAGESNSADFQTSSDAYATNLAGSNDAFVAKISNDGSSLLYCSFIGGNLADIAYAVLDEGADNLIVGGVTNSGNFPTVSSTFDATHNGSSDSFISKISLVCQPVGLNATTNSPVCAGQELVLSGLPSGMVSYSWTGPGKYLNTNQNATISNVSADYSGQYTFTAIDSDGCEGTITINVEVIDMNLMVVHDENALVAQQAGALYQWLDCNQNFSTIASAQNQSFTLDSPGSFAVEITLQGCKDTSACMLVTGMSPIDISNVHIYPNPAKELIFFHSNSDEAIFISDLRGNIALLKQNNGEKPVKIDLSNLPSGAYIVRQGVYYNRFIKL